MPKIHPETKVLIIKRLKTRSTADVADTFNVSQRQVQRIKKRFEETGDVFDKPRSGRPRKTTAREDRLLARKSKASSFSTAAELHETWSPEVPVSTRTVCRILSRNGLHGRIRAQKPALNKRRLKNRVAFAKAHSLLKGWTLENWQKVDFSDETSVELHHSTSSATAGVQVGAEGGLGFDTPAQVTTLQNANKDRIKGAMQRRPQSRAARHSAARRSEDARLDSQEENSSLQAGSSARTTSASSAFNPIPVRPSALTLPITTNTTKMSAPTVSDGVVRPKILTAAEDLFSSEDIFASVPKHTPSPRTKTKAPETAFHGASNIQEPALPIFSHSSDELFATVKPKMVKKSKAMAFLDDDDDGIFGTEKKKESKSLGSDDKETSSKVLPKPKERSLEASLFDDDVDIFADLTPTTKSKEKKPKKKVETKSIFDDDMDDIFSSGITKPVGASTAKKSKKPVQDPNPADESGQNIFDDPLNVFGGK